MSASAAYNHFSENPHRNQLGENGRSDYVGMLRHGAPCLYRPGKGPFSQNKKLAYASVKNFSRKTLCYLKL
jgi:hypothetical protein